MERASQVVKNSSEANVFEKLSNGFDQIKGDRVRHDKLWWLWQSENNEGKFLETILDDVIMLVKYYGEDL
jgi:hypothetical protein